MGFLWSKPDTYEDDKDFTLTDPDSGQNVVEIKGKVSIKSRSNLREIQQLESEKQVRKMEVANQMLATLATYRAGSASSVPPGAVPSPSPSSSPSAPVSSSSPPARSSSETTTPTANTTTGTVKMKQSAQNQAMMNMETESVHGEGNRLGGEEMRVKSQTVLRPSSEDDQMSCDGQRPLGL